MKAAIKRGNWGQMSSECAEAPLAASAARPLSNPGRVRVGYAGCQIHTKCR